MAGMWKPRLPRVLMPCWLVSGGTGAVPTGRGDTVGEEEPGVPEAGAGEAATASVAVELGTAPTGAPLVGAPVRQE